MRIYFKLVYAKNVLSYVLVEFCDTSMETSVYIMAVESVIFLSTSAFVF